jgi:hypothetical protein
LLVLSRPLWQLELQNYIERGSEVNRSKKTPLSGGADWAEKFGGKKKGGEGKFGNGGSDG